MTASINLTQKCFLGAAVFIIALLGYSTAARADTSFEDLKKIINQKNQEIQKLEEEAKLYRAEIAQKQERGKTLKDELVRIDRTIKQLQNDIYLTQKRIESTQLEIESLNMSVREKEFSIEKLRSGMGNLLFSLAQEEYKTPLEIMLQNAHLSDYFQQLQYVSILEGKMSDSLIMLKKLKDDLNADKYAAEVKKKNSENLKKLLASKRSSLASEKNEKNDLLNTTKKEENRYQTLLREREAKRNALEQEIETIEAKIKFSLNNSLLPAKGSGILGYPLPEISLGSCFTNITNAINCITQYFGYTSFAAIGGYSGKGHNGVDFRAAYGTPVFSATDGTVEGTGDTDLGCRGASYGKWLLIRHSNNLSTLYGHLSVINVSIGQRVTKGDNIGLSGNSGYATGPHLHFTVFASQAVNITSIRSKVCGKDMTLPISAINGYLNPLDYL